MKELWHIILLDAKTQVEKWGRIKIQLVLSLMWILQYNNYELNQYIYPLSMVSMYCASF